MKATRYLKRLWFRLIFDPERQYGEVYEFKVSELPATRKEQFAFIEQKAYELLPEWVRIEKIVIDAMTQPDGGMKAYMGWKSIPARKKREMVFA